MVYVDNDNIQFTKYEDIITSFFNTSFYKIFINEYELSKIDESIKTNINLQFVIIMEKGSRNNLQGAVFAARETIEWMRDNTEYTK